MAERTLVLGCGFTGLAVATLVRSQGNEVVVHARSKERADELRALGFQVLEIAVLDAAISAHVDRDTHVVISFPPDGQSDARVAPAIAHAKSITYVSSTGVYGSTRGHIDDQTPLMASLSERSARIIKAEALYREVGATILRCPGIYGPDRGLHIRVTSGIHQIPGDGSHTLSRIHVEDLAQLIVAAAKVRGETFVVGDLEPAPHIDVVKFICEQYEIALPPFTPLESVHESLRADRAVDSSRALNALGVTLRYPTYREGMRRNVNRLGS